MDSKVIKFDLETPLHESTRRALVTGCGGVLGYALVKRLLADGWHVTGTTRSGNAPIGLENNRQFDILSVELTTGDSIELLLDSLKLDVVFHLAASNDNSVPEGGPLPIMMTNILGTLKLLEAVRKKAPHVTIVLTSSIESAYASQSNATLTPYQCSKLTIELLAKCFRDSYGISCGVIQLTSLYGPGDKSNRRLIPYCIRKLAKCEPIDILSPLDTKRDFLYAEDAAEALLVASENAGFLAGQVFSVSSGEQVRIGDLVVLLRRIANGDKDSEFAIQTEVAKSFGPPPLTDWTPKMTIENGLIETWNWYKEFEANV
jgi:nucleoside-diphosphate-sugar epimerase